LVTSFLTLGLHLPLKYNKLAKKESLISGVALNGPLEAPGGAR